MKVERGMEKLIRELDLDLDINAKADDAILGEILASQKSTKSTRLAVIRPRLWRIGIVMNSVKSRRVKMAIAIIVLMVCIGIVPINETTVFGKIADNVTSTMARLKAMVKGEEVSEAENTNRPIDKSIIIHTKSSVYSSPKISSLEDFLLGQNISFNPVTSGTGKHAVIPSDIVAALQEFLQSSDSYGLVASPSILAHSGQEAMIAIVNTAGAAITAQQHGNELNINFAFHNGQDGYDINEIELKNGEALLISGIKNDIDDLMTILVLPEVE